MRYRRVFNFAAAGLFLALVAGTALLAKREIFVATTAPLWDSAWILQNPEGLQPAYSISANTEAIAGCLRVVNGAESLFLPQNMRFGVVRSCRALARDITAASEDNAYAWFALAKFAQILGQTAMFNHALERAYATGPTEQWIAEQRVELAEEALETLSSRALSGHKKDLALLVRSPRGIRAIARRYLRDAGFRDRITQVVEALSADDQVRFVSLIRLEARQP